MQKHAGALGTWAWERRSTRIPFLWDPTIAAGPVQDLCRRHLPRGLLCRTEARDTLENLIKTQRFA